MSQMELIKHLENEYTSVPDVIASFDWLERFFLDYEDLRGIFTTAYLHITRSLNEALEANAFKNNSWSRDYLIHFANLYRLALLDFENKNLNKIPKSWRKSFELAYKREGLIIQHLFLGINAHINHDLAIALFDIKIDPNRNQKYSDHIQINLILEKATKGLKEKVANKYAPILKRLDRGFGTIDDEFTTFSIPKAREHAWSCAIALTAARSEIEREILRNSLDEQAGVLSNLIMASPTKDPRFIGVVNLLKKADKKIDRFVSFFRS